MPCIPNPIPGPGTIGGPFSIPGPPTFTPPTGPDAKLCCQSVSFPAIPALLPLPIPPPILEGAVAFIDEGLEAIQAFLDSIEPDCPRS